MDDWNVEGSTLLIIGGGGATVIEHALGCIKAIQQIHGAKFDYAMGTSAGAIVTSMLFSFDQDVGKFENTIKTTPMRDWFVYDYIAAITTLFKGKFNYIAKPTGLENFIYNYLTEQGAIERKVSGKYKIDYDKTYEALETLGAAILKIQANGDYDAAVAFAGNYGFVPQAIQQDVVNLELEKIPVDIRFEYEK